jgi:uncharacterized membrane protein
VEIDIGDAEAPAVPSAAQQTAKAPADADAVPISVVITSTCANVGVAEDPATEGVEDKSEVSDSPLRL